MHSFLSRPRLFYPRLFHPRFPLLVSALALLALAPSAAQAQVTTYTSASEFQAASLVNAPFHFDGYASPGDIYYYGHSFSFDSVGFSSSSLKVVSPNDEFGDPFGGHQFLSGVSNDPMYMNLPSGVTAFGADFATLDGGPLDITVNYDQVFHFDSGTAFAGFVSDAPITSLSVDGGASRLGVSGLQWGDAAPVPEASSVVSLGLLLLCAGGIAVLRRRRAAPRSD